MPAAVWDDVLSDALLSRHHRAHAGGAVPPVVHSDLLADAITWDRTTSLAHGLAHAFQGEEGLHGEPMAVARERYAALAGGSGSSAPRDAGDESARATDEKLLQHDGSRDRDAGWPDGWHLDQAADRGLE